MRTGESAEDSSRLHDADGGGGGGGGGGGEIPVVDTDGELIGVVTDRDIVCRMLGAGKNPLDHTV